MSGRGDGDWNDDDLPYTVATRTVAGDLISDQSAPIRLTDPTTGAGLFTTNTDPAVTGTDPLTGEDALAGTDVGFGSALRRYLWAGLHNGDLAVGPRDPSTLISTGNPLPYWRLVQVSGAAVTATWADGTVTLAMDAGAAGDDGAFEQLHAINRSAYQEWAYVVTGYVSASTTATATAYLEGQFLTATGAATGSAVRTEADTGELTVVMGATPTGAVYLRVRFGIERDALAATGTASRTWTEVAVHPAPDTLYLSNATERAASVTATGSTGYFELRPDAAGTPVVELEAAPDVLSPVRVKNGSSTVIAAVPVGLAPYAYPMGLTQSSTSGGGLNLDAVTAGSGGARAVAVHVPSMMLVESLSIWSTDTANLRTAEWALYWDQAEAATNTLISVHDPFIGSAMGTFSFTPGGSASVQTSTATGGPYRIAPGTYWLVLRNTSTARTFGVGFSSVGTLSTNHMRATTGTTSLTIGIDISGWTSSGGLMLARLNGRIGAEASGF